MKHHSFLQENKWLRATQSFFSFLRPCTEEPGGEMAREKSPACRMWGVPCTVVSPCRESLRSNSYQL